MKGMLYVSVIVALLSSQSSQKEFDKTQQAEQARSGDGSIQVRNDYGSVQACDDYGAAVVSSVLKIDQHGMIHCNIEGFPAVIGRNMPVQIKGLKPSVNPQDNLPILRFLNELLLSEKDKPERIELRHIQRGTAFCLLADVEVEGQDLCDLLVDKGLVKRVIEVPSSTPAVNTALIQSGMQPTTTTRQAARVSGNAIVASKTSKVYHRASCSHAKRIEPEKLVRFTNSTEAERTGRRPCKTCKP